MRLLVLLIFLLSTNVAWAEDCGAVITREKSPFLMVRNRTIQEYDQCRIANALESIAESMKEKS